VKSRLIVVPIILAAALALFYTQTTIFVIPPIGALPEGKTVLISRLNKTEFIDSPDAMCERIQGSVSLLCRGMVLAAVIEKSTIIVRLPYSSWLYSISTKGKQYDR
jgi:hypothetical protein